MEVNQIYNCKAEDLLLKMQADSIQLTVTSPPYDDLRSYNSVFDLELIIHQLFRVTKPGGVVVWVVADQTKNFTESGTSFRTALAFIEAGWCLYDTMIWLKKNYMPTGNPRYPEAFEYMFVFSKGKPSTFNPLNLPTVYKGKKMLWKTRPYQSKAKDRKEDEWRQVADERKRSNVWEYAVGYQLATQDKFVHEHPAIFPEALAADHIKTWSNENDVVLDIFSGSATTAKMAKLLGRQYIGSEINPEYWELGNKRLQLHKNLFN